jgi:hypothetical protein
MMRATSAIGAQHPYDSQVENNLLIQKQIYWMQDAFYQITCPHRHRQ